jgi:ABC-type sugar transport system substrate-binding protein
MGFGKKISIVLASIALASASLLVACESSTTSSKDSGKKQLKIGVDYETLQTSYWVSSHDTMKAELKKRGYEMVDAVADNDANKQFEQIRNFIAQKVDGIIVVPKDAKTVIPMIKAANKAHIPIVVYNRPPAPNDGEYVTVIADNKKISADTVQFLADQAKKTGEKQKAMILVGDLGDQNAIDRRDGFLEIVEKNKDIIDVVAKVPTEWNQEKALAGVTNALQAHPDINFIFASSDFLFPSVIQALKSTNKWKKIGEKGHVILGGFDGDDGAYKLLKDGYLDATGVQDMYYESEHAVQAIVDQIEGKKVDQKLLDPGFVINQDNLSKEEGRMWGAQVFNKSNK